MAAALALTCLEAAPFPAGENKLGEHPLLDGAWTGPRQPG
jgi:hypothetical protein